jgi:hypothetical protein
VRVAVICLSMERSLSPPASRMGLIDPRGNIVATLADPYASDASVNARYLDDSEAPGSMLRGCTRLRALWGDFPVVVRVHSSA